MRLILIGASALLLAGCGGEEYPVPASEAFATLSGVGKPPELFPLPGGLYDVAVNFEAVGADQAVKWHFSHEGDDLATIIARVEPSGDNASTVSIEYVEGTAPDENWRNGQARSLIQNGIQQLVVEAVDSKFEKRPFDAALRANVAATTTAMSVGGIMQDASASMDAEIERRKQRERESQAAAEANPYNKTKPSMDLSKYN